VEPVEIYPSEIDARINELQALLTDSSVNDALNSLIRADLALSAGSTKRNSIEIAQSMKSIKEIVDILIVRSIGLLSDTETNIVDVDNRLAEEI